MDNNNNFNQINNKKFKEVIIPTNKEKSFKKYVMINPMLLNNQFKWDKMDGLVLVPILLKEDQIKVGKTK